MTRSSPSSEEREVSFREARPEDLAAIVALLADDGLGRGRETLGATPDEAYRKAFAAMELDPRNVMLVTERAGEIVGYCQVTFIPGLSRRGAERALIESVRVASHLRNHGIGAAMMKHVIAMARARGASLVQLTSDRRRDAAHRFYERLGFAPSHLGFKLDLSGG